ncbi:uncharacterized protein N7459_008580 [Penicillium hispanicum]|uniref:uncharacterized protein n=1 Tax=Penicillium hispanicum TaxID=1080232 RepID=UPI0025425B6A|nr:uncharacterized protein N7459_008580 [Penicillium hispanicum]KAJ5574153.1 hypothetical protein N7459_008580 [Penicillium hispanicum]
MPRSKGSTRGTAVAETKPVEKGNLTGALNCENKEKTLAGYLGFSTTGELQQLAVSWPVQKAVIQASKIWSSISRPTILNIVSEDEDNISKQTSMVQWDPHPEDDKSTASNKRCFMFSWILLQLEKDLDIYVATTPEENRSYAVQYQAEFLECLRSAKTKGPTTNFMLPSHIGCPVPQLGPFPEMGEGRLEKLNCCLELMKYVHSIASTTNFWQVRMSTITGIHSKEKVAKFLPGWMQPKAGKKDDDTLPIPGDLQLTEPAQLPPIEVTVIWEENCFPSANEMVHQVLEDALKRNIPMPPKHSTLQYDPRLCEDEAMMRDMLRRHLDTHRLGVDFESILLEYHEGRRGRPWSLDLFGTMWEGIKGALSDPENSEFEIKVQFCALDDPESTMFENHAFPPWLQVMEPASTSSTLLYWNPNLYIH